jgi:hypothetical protein
MRWSLQSLWRSIVHACAGLAIVVVSASNGYAAGADYDGNGFSEIPVLTTGANGKYTWQLFDPFSGKTTVFTQGFGGPRDRLALANWIYPKVTSAGVVGLPNAGSNGRLVWRIRTAVRSSGRGRVRRRQARKATIREQVKYLGRPGDILIAGGDFNGDKVADAVVITNRGTGQHKWGLRGSFFLASYNPGLNVNRAYFDFGTIGLDRPFFMNPDGRSDWFAVVRNVGDGRQVISLTQPFTKATRTISGGKVPDDANLPVPLAQDDGTDFLIFFGANGGQTEVVVKDLAGETVFHTEVPIVGELTVGNYGPGPGEEFAISNGGSFYVINPNTGRVISMSGPVGFAADSININSL